MIKGIIIDVDGVVIGEKKGFNFPDPHKDVISRLRKIEGNGVPISLCTAKPHFSIRAIIQDANLRSLHITDGGGVIIDPLDDVILKKHIIDRAIAGKVVQACLDRGTYVEFYTVNEYFAQASQHSDITEIHADILQAKPHVVESLLEQLEKEEITKIMPVVQNDEDMHELDKLLQPLTDRVTISWGTHPVALPRRFGIVTAKGISKQQAAHEIAEHNNIVMDDLLGIGDSTADWQFIEQCGYAGAMGNASDELKRLIATKGEKSFVGKAVDKNGIIDILDYFEL
ncbi:MAG TPA: HAD family hydrolase [Verrucomicrobiae bacterium]|nr:HAD family hydrolase [Verrucomicrobiae bacterium]